LPGVSAITRVANPLTVRAGTHFLFSRTSMTSSAPCPWRTIATRIFPPVASNTMGPCCSCALRTVEYTKTTVNQSKDFTLHPKPMSLRVFRLAATGDALQPLPLRASLEGKIFLAVTRPIKIQFTPAPRILGLGSREQRPTSAGAGENEPRMPIPFPAGRSPTKFADASSAWRHSEHQTRCLEGLREELKRHRSPVGILRKTR
jgi:hypothetical protein